MLDTPFGSDDMVLTKKNLTVNCPEAGYCAQALGLQMLRFFEVFFYLMVMVIIFVVLS